MVAADGITLEQTVLGHALNNRVCFQLFVSELDERHFTAPNHKVIAYCLKSMGGMGVRSPDEDTFQLVVNGYPGEEKDYGGAEYIRSLKSAFIDPTDNYEKIVEALKLAAIKHAIRTTRVTELSRASNDPEVGVDDIRAILNSIVLDVEAASTSGYRLEKSEDVGNRYLQSLDARANIPFATTGLTSLDDHLVEGFAPKLITVMAGFTGMAKSTVAINMAHRIACTGTGAAIFSMESTDIALYDKLVSTLTQIPVNRLKKESAELTAEERERINTAVRNLSQIPLFINDQPSVSVDNIFYQIQSAQRRGYDPKVIFIDLFGKVEDVDTGENLAQRIQRECKRMRVLAKTLAVHFVLVVQIGRQGFGRQRGGRIRRPTLIDIKNANAYAEECDIALLLHRNKYYEQDLEDDVLEIDIAKQRNGEVVKVYFELFPETSTIVDTNLLPHDVVRRDGNA